MDESHKQDEKKQKASHKPNVWFYLCCVQNQAKLKMMVGSQDSGYPSLRRSDGRDYEENFCGC